MSSKKYEYILTESAQTDLDEIREYISSTLLNPDAADSFLDSFEENVDNICKLPKSGRLVVNEYLKREGVRRFLVKNYIAYYLVDDKLKNIVILRVVYEGRDLNKILREL